MKQTTIDRIEEEHVPGGPVSMPPTTPAALWVQSGLLGGALAGLFDVGAAVAAGIGGISPGKALRLALVAVSVLGAAGGLAGALAAAFGAVERGRRAVGRLPAIFAAVVAGPLIARNAFALFTGHQAAQVPGHRAISVALIVAGLAGVYAFARFMGRLLSRPATPRQRAVAILLLALAIGSAFANRFALPRLYGWFHDTLSVTSFIACVLAARLLARTAPQRRVRVLVLVGAAAAVGAVLQLRSSQVMRYAAHERTAATALALRAVPLVLRSKAVAAEHRAAEAALAPLPSGPRRPEADVILITVDALRADHVGAYGYKRATTPNIDALAAGGVRFARAYAQAPHTSFSIASMLTGKYFATLARLAPGERHEPIAAVLRTYGWKTAAFYPPAVFYVDAHKLKSYADTNFDFEYVKFEYIDAQRRVDQVLSYFQTARPGRSFVWIHFFEPHEPYERHPEFNFGAGDVDRYDSEIAYTDAAVGRLVAAARARHPGTVVVLGADHGEEFDEHGGRYHGSTLYDEQLRIPLIISIPGVEPHVVEGQVQLIDVAPTLLNLLNIPVPVRMRGTDLGPWLSPTPAPADRLPPAFAEVEDKRMVVFGTDKLLCDMHWGVCAYHDLSSDPGERRNLAEERPDRAGAMRARLDEWLDGHVRFEPLLAKGASNPEGGPVPKAIERGRLGDVLAVSDLAALIAGDAPLSQRREAAELLVGLPPRAEAAEALGRAAADPDRVVSDWASVGAARLGDGSVRRRVRAITVDTQAEPKLRVQAALALASVGEGTGVFVLADALDRCEDVLLCRLIVITLGKLGDRRAVPMLLRHLPEVQNRREMVAALGDIGDSTAAEALLGRLREDEYVPVRIEAAQALAKIGAKNGDVGLGSLMERAVRDETESSVVAAARTAAAKLRGGQAGKVKTP